MAQLVAATIGYEGAIAWDETKPDGTPRKLLDVTRLTELGWHPRRPLADGVRETYAWYMANVAEQG